MHPVLYNQLDSILKSGSVDDAIGSGSRLKMKMSDEKSAYRLPRLKHSFRLRGGRHGISSPAGDPLIVPDMQQISVLFPEIVLINSQKSSTKY